MDREQQLRALYALPIYSLPPELILDIVGLLYPVDFVNFVFATFHLLRHHGIAPAVSTAHVCDLLLFHPQPEVFPGGTPSLLTLPIELLMEIISYMNTTDMINFVLGVYQPLVTRSIARGLSSGMSAQFSVAYYQSMKRRGQCALRPATN